MTISSHDYGPIGEYAVRCNICTFTETFTAPGNGDILPPPGTRWVCFDLVKDLHVCPGCQNTSPHDCLWEHIDILRSGEPFTDDGKADLSRQMEEAARRASMVATSMPDPTQDRPVLRNHDPSRLINHQEVNQFVRDMVKVTRNGVEIESPRDLNLGMADVPLPKEIQVQIDDGQGVPVEVDYTSAPQRMAWIRAMMEGMSVVVSSPSILQVNNMDVVNEGSTVATTVFCRDWSGLCACCQEQINDGELVAVCEECDTPHHDRCWVKGQECARYACECEKWKLGKYIEPKEEETVKPYGNHYLDYLRSRRLRPSQIYMWGKMIIAWSFRPVIYVSRLPRRFVNFESGELKLIEMAFLFIVLVLSSLTGLWLAEQFVHPVEARPIIDAPKKERVRF